MQLVNDTHMQCVNSEMIVPEHSQDVQSLLCLHNEVYGVGAPGQVIFYVDAQKPDVGS